MNDDVMGPSASCLQLVSEVRAGLPLDEAVERHGVPIGEASRGLFDCLITSPAEPDDLTHLMSAVEVAERTLGRPNEVVALHALVNELRLRAGAGRPAAVRLARLVDELDREGATKQGIVLRVRAIRSLYTSGELEAPLAERLAHVGGESLDTADPGAFSSSPFGRGLVHIAMASAAIATGKPALVRSHVDTAVGLLTEDDAPPGGPDISGFVAAALALQLRAAEIGGSALDQSSAALVRIEAMLGPDHLLVCDAQEQLLELVMNSGNTAEIASLLPTAVRTFERLLPGDPRTWTIRLASEMRARDQDARPRGVDHWRTLADRIADDLGKNDPLVFHARFEIMRALTVEQPDEGGVYAAQLLEDSVRALGKADPMTRNVRQFVEHRRQHHGEAHAPSASAPSANNKLTGSKKTKERTVNEFRQRISEHGWIVHAIGAQCDESSHGHQEHDHGPDFGYTNGMSRFHDHPDFIMTGIPQNAVAEMLNIVAGRVQQGERFLAGQQVEGLADGYLVHLLDVDPANSLEFLTMANAVYRMPGRPPIRALQVVFPDADHRWPWDSGASDGFRAAQPLLGAPPHEGPDQS